MTDQVRKKRAFPEIVSPEQGKSRLFALTLWARVNWLQLFQTLLIIGTGFWIFSPALHGDWLWDDDLYITQNPLLNSLSGLWKIWFHPGSFVEYYPIEESVQWVQWHLWGTNTRGYHLTNVGLHLLSALLVWRLLSKLGLRLAWFGGLIFAIHPTAVESVAWIAELKNTLSLPFFLLAMCAYIDYEERKSRHDYFLALGLFLLAMLCKITMAPFPAVILLYDWWKRGNIGWNDLKASLPFFVISLVLGLTTIWAGNWYAQNHVQGHDIDHVGSIFSRLALAGLTISFYFTKYFWPVGLLPIYPKWSVDPPSLLQFLPWLVLTVMIYGLRAKRQSWGRHVLLGLGFFLFNLMPFVGLISVSYMSFTWVMDHFLYIPIIGLIGVTVAGLEQIDNRLSQSLRCCGIGGIVMMTALMALESHSYAGIFINQETLWTYTLQRNSDALPAHNNLGIALRQDGRMAEAMEQFQAVLRIDPNDTEARDNLGNALFRTGQMSEAIQQYEESLQINPADARAHNGMGTVLAKMRHLPEAAEHLEIALRINPNDEKMHYSMALLKLQMGQTREAMEQFEAALEINPNDADVHYHMGNTLFRAGQLSEAVDHYQQALKIKPDYAEVHNNLGIVLLRTGRMPEAVEQFETALRINPNYIDARNNLTRIQKTPR
jgi:tetratricopeptide (TPR) repeat protein